MSEPGPARTAASTAPVGDDTVAPAPGPDALGVPGGTGRTLAPAAGRPVDEPGGRSGEQPEEVLVRTPAETPADKSRAASVPAPAVRLGARRRAGLLVTFILGGLTALPALSMDMYLPALPAVGGTLHTPAATAQLTLTGCLLGLAVGQLVVGPMSDQFGRRRPLLIGMSGYVVAGVACAFAPTVETLIVCRLVQGLTGAAGIVIARAVVRDLYDGLAMARFFSTLMLISGLAPILAPVLGGQILRFTDWRGVFLILAGIGVVLTTVVARCLPETLEPHRRHSGGVPDALRTMRGLFADRVFTGYLLAGSFGFAALFAYVSASPFVIQEIYGASPQTFSLLFMVNSVGLVAAGQINGKLLVGRVPLDRVLGFGLCVTGAAAVALLLMTSGVFGRPGLLPVAAALCVLMTGMGFLMPNANSQGLMRASHAAGSASALLGTSQFLIGAIASPLVGIAGERTAVPMALTQLAALCVAALAFLGLCRPWRSARN
ncbi:DHA1 family bicyclomycin/chloramphenicol resistance-like MFS transporter [Streptomyces sp. Amel2xB2]|uniref:multidrug effflux MFS transporter n=1 Tax=Streptomyces sp. Amel2xB2 TaxID=1305829 RepID=UPI000DB924ED|nr:multidrug effflux MFS transporter [Streptomyces sp. Amel2xB2]RAJ58271.1 DHA1 family bicyclomycin/chloramphenicol resistance-like MFS transporter [Streptomyces sp. Amel2xB2]